MFSECGRLYVATAALEITSASVGAGTGVNLTPACARVAQAAATTRKSEARRIVLTLPFSSMCPSMPVGVGSRDSRFEMVPPFAN
jgi:hypothetical protein